MCSQTHRQIELVEQLKICSELLKFHNVVLLLLAVYNVLGADAACVECLWPCVFTFLSLNSA